MVRIVFAKKLETYKTPTERNDYKIDMYKQTMMTLHFFKLESLEYEKALYPANKGIHDSSVYIVVSRNIACPLMAISNIIKLFLKPFPLSLKGNQIQRKLFTIARAENSNFFA